MILTKWQLKVAGMFDVPAAFLATESVIPHRYNEAVQAMQVTDAMITAYGKAWAEQNDKPGNEVGARRRAGLTAALEVLAQDPGVVLMTREVFEDVEGQLRKLRALESAGVDNWSGYDSAMEEIWAAEDEAQMFRPKHG